MGILIWLVERRRNADQFHARPIQGIGNGFWWAAVTMATVGYGDKAPVTLLGRTIAIVWMFAALILMAVFTAHLTSSLTLRGISGAVTDINDLPRARVGIVGNSASASFFEKRFIRTQSFPDVAAGLEALASDKIDAFVHDEPILRYHIARSHHGVIELLPKLFEAADYAVVLPTGSPLREPINESILNSIESSDWAVLLAKYLGPGD
jgi:ABC-type amino acid transport substrate-binding protein